MPIKGFTWNEEYRKKYYSSERVQAHLEQFLDMVSQPKPPEQRAKMSAAKKGRKYSEQHRQNMSEAQKFRQALRKEFETQQPDLPREEIWALVKERIEQ